MKSVTFKINYWDDQITKDDNSSTIHMGGLSAEGKTVHIFVHGYEPACYLQLPNRLSWNVERCRRLYNRIQDVCGFNGPMGDFNQKTHMVNRKILHYAEPVCCLKLFFSSRSASMRCGSTLNHGRGFFVEGVGKFLKGDLLLHERTIPSVVKFATSQGLLMAGWATAKGTDPIRDVEDIDSDVDDVEGESVKTGLTEADIELSCRWDNVKSYEPKEIVKVYPKYLSFDIECNSKNHNSKLPDPEVKENVVNQISMIFGKLYNKNRHGILLSLGEPKNVIGADELRVHKSEKALLLDFSSLLRENDPTMIIGYNIMKFDWHYMIKRAELLHIFDEFSQISRIIDERTVIVKDDWSSNAYGRQEFSYMDPRGRVMVDALLEVERSHKLPTYGLDAVAEKFLNTHKEDIRPRHLFMIWQLTSELLPIIPKDKLITRKKLILYKKKVKSIFEDRRCHTSDTIISYRAKLLEADGSTFRDTVCEAMELMGKYCMKDSVLALDLVEKLNLWTTMEEFASVTCVPMSFLYTRGQQIKVLAQAYKQTSKLGLIIPHVERTNIKVPFEGALVAKAMKGYHVDVASLDFTSLYPTIIISHNMCFTSIARTTGNIKESDYHKVDFESHVGCAHDLLKRKRKPEKVICGSFLRMFKRVKYVENADGSLSPVGEGVIPGMCRKLLIERKIVKMEMAKWEARCKMHTGDASAEDLETYKKYGYTIIERGSLSAEEFEEAQRNFTVLNVKQLAIKVACNSIYGILGADDGLLAMKALGDSVTAVGRLLITEVMTFLKDEYPNMVYVYGDTDSGMIKFIGVPTKEMHAACKIAVKKATTHLRCMILNIDKKKLYGKNKRPVGSITLKDPDFFLLSFEDKCEVMDYERCPINLEFENLYGSYSLFTKKRYIAYICNDEGQITGRIKKGMCEARRDNCSFLRITSKMMNDEILGKVVDDKIVRGKESDVMDILYQRIRKLYSIGLTTKPSHSSEQLLITLGVKDLADYAKKMTVTRDGKTETYFVDKNKEPIFDITGADDPRLFFEKKILQVILLRKLRARGEIIASNTRLEYIYLQNESAKCQGDKAEEYSYFLENKSYERYKIDYEIYLEKQLMKPITETLEVNFPKPVIPYVDLEVKIGNYFRRELNELHRFRIATLKDIDYIPDRYKPEGKIVIGKSAVESDLEDDTVIVTPRRYRHTGMDAKVTYIIRELKSKDGDENSMTVEQYPGLMDLCMSWKSQTILNRLHTSHGSKKRVWKKPKNIGDNIPVHGKIVMIADGGGEFINERFEDTYAVGDCGKVVSRNELEGSTKTKKIFSYNIRMENEGTGDIHEVPRCNFSPYTLKDGTVMQDILFCRQIHRLITAEIINLFGGRVIGNCKVVVD